MFFFFFQKKTAYEMRISDWSSDVCSSDLRVGRSSVAAALRAEAAASTPASPSRRRMARSRSAASAESCLIPTLVEPHATTRGHSTTARAYQRANRSRGLLQSEDRLGRDEGGTQGRFVEEISPATNQSK